MDPNTSLSLSLSQLLWILICSAGRTSLVAKQTEIEKDEDEVGL